MKRLLFALLIISVILASFALALDENLLIEYSDVTTWHWAYETIQKLSSKGIISGYPDGTFKPNNNITRAEASKIFMEALNPDGVFSYGIDVCPDVTRFHWASRYIINAKIYIKLYDDGLFKPEQDITRLEFANAIAEKLKFTNAVLNIKSNTDDINLTDINDLDEKSVENIKYLVKVGIINGYEDNTFRPNNNLTRAEACKVLSLAMTYLDNGIKAEVSQRKGWTTVDTNTAWNSPLRFDTDGNIKYFISDSKEEAQLYYNGVYFMTPNKNITTVKKEKLYTPDGLEWDVIWMGPKVVDYMQSGDKYILVDYYQDKQFEFDNYYVREAEAIKVAEELFPYLTFKISYENDKLFMNHYSAKTGSFVGSLQIVDYVNDLYGKYRISIKNLKSVIWSEEVNGNYQDQIDFINSYYEN